MYYNNHCEKISWKFYLSYYIVYIILYVFCEKMYLIVLDTSSKTFYVVLWISIPVKL